MNGVSVSAQRHCAIEGLLLFTQAHSRPRMQENSERPGISIGEQPGITLRQSRDNAPPRPLSSILPPHFDIA